MIMPRSTDSAASTAERTRELPEILRAEALARIVTPILADMIDEALIRYEAAHLGRVMAEPLNACRALVREIRQYHGLPELTADAAPLATTNGTVPEEARS
jgi:hypothetical protein